MKKLVILFISIFFVSKILSGNFFIYNKSDEKISIKINNSNNYDVEPKQFFKVANSTSFDMSYNDVHVNINFEDKAGITPLFVIDIAKDVKPFVFKKVDIHSFRDAKQDNKRKSIVSLFPTA